MKNGQFMAICTGALKMKRHSPCVLLVTLFLFFSDLAVRNFLLNFLCLMEVQKFVF